MGGMLQQRRSVVAVCAASCVSLLWVSQGLAARSGASSAGRRLLEYDFSKGHLRTLTTIAIAESSVSFLGGSFVLFSFAFFPNLRSKFAFEQVANMALADMGAALTYWFGSPRDRSDLCTSQAVLQQFFELASVLWATVIATTLHLAIRRVDVAERRRRRAAYAFSWCLPLAVAVLPLTTSSYGASGAWCWIRPRPRVPSAAWRFSIFYVPVWLAIAYNGAVYANCAWVLERLRSVADDAAADTLRATIHRLARYPLILVACWGVPTVNRLQQIITPDRPVFALYVGTVMTRSMLGFLNALAFGVTHNVKHEWRQFLAKRNVLPLCAAARDDTDMLIDDADARRGARPASPAANPLRASEAKRASSRASSIELSNSVASETPPDLADVDLATEDDAALAAA